MYRFILPLVVLVPHDSNVAVDTQVWFRSSKKISSVAGISKILCTSEVASAICENVRHLRLGTNSSCVVCSEGSKNVWNANYKVHAYVISMEFSAVNRRRPSYETPLGPGAKKDGCFRRLNISRHARMFS